jgi:metallophosphoesterase superfamily enzyme
MKPTAIITADIHIRESRPRNRIDNFWEAQKRKIEFILDLQHKYNGIPILDGGDFLHSWKSSPFLENWIIRKFRKYIFPNMITIPGTHDTPNHNINSLDHSSLSVLEAARTLRILKDIQSSKTISSSCSSDIEHVVYGFPQGKLSDIKFQGKKDSYNAYLCL